MTCFVHYGHNHVPGLRGKTTTSPVANLPVDERPIITRDHGQVRSSLSIGGSPDERFVDGPGFGGGNDGRGSPAKSKPRTLRSGEGSRPQESREYSLRFLSDIFPSPLALSPPYALLDAIASIAWFANIKRRSLPRPDHTALILTEHLISKLASGWLPAECCWPIMVDSFLPIHSAFPTSHILELSLNPVPSGRRLLVCCFLGDSNHVR